MARKIKVERYYPSVIANAKEFTDIANSENPEFELLAQSLYKWFLNGFVYDLDKDGAERWEDMLSITPKAIDTLKQRKQRILARLNTMLPYTHRRLIEMLDGIYGVKTLEVNLDYQNYWLYIDIPKNLYYKIQELLTYLRAIVPANLGIGFTNTTKINQPTYLGGIIQQVKTHNIKASTGFKPDNLIQKTTLIGKTTQIKYINIKGGN